MTRCQKICGHAFVQHPVRNVCAKFRVDHLSRFRTRTCQVFTTQKSFPYETPVTTKPATSNFL